MPGTLPYKHDPRPARFAQPAFQSGAVPLAVVRRRRIGALEELHQRLPWVARGSHPIVRQDELAKLLAEERLDRAHRGGGKAFWRRIGIGVESRVIDRPAARPEAGARHFMGIGFPGHGIGQMRHAAGMGRGAPAGKPRHREIEAAPEEMHRAHLAEKRRAEMGKHLMRAQQHPPEPVGEVAVVGAVDCDPR